MGMVLVLERERWARVRLGTGKVGCRGMRLGRGMRVELLLLLRRVKVKVKVEPKMRVAILFLHKKTSIRNPKLF
jgi:hypothetical protein